MQKIFAFLASLALLAVMTVPAFADQNLNIQVPFSGSAVNPCNGETVDFSGFVETLENYTVDSNGGVHLTANATLQGVSGVGQTTGAKYQVQENTTIMENFVGFPPIIEAFVLKEKFIGQGNVPGFTLQVNAHLTFNADGTLSVYFTNVSTTCN